MALRSRSSGSGFKPPHVAGARMPARGERCGKDVEKAPVEASGGAPKTQSLQEIRVLKTPPLSRSFDLGHVRTRIRLQDQRCRSVMP